MKAFRVVLATVALVTAIEAKTTTTRYFVGGTFTRQSVSPHGCPIASECAFQCAVTYNVQVNGDQLTATPTDAQPVKGCVCTVLVGTIRTNGVAIGTAGGSAFVVTATSIGLRIDETIGGMVCSAEYTGNTVSKTATTAVRTHETSERSLSTLWSSVAAAVFANKVGIA